MNNYITVDEFIKLKNISYDTFMIDYNIGVYDLYSIKKNKEIYISVSLIDDYKPTPKEKDIIHQNNNTETNNNNINPDNTAELKAEIERLRNEIAEKDKKIIEFAEMFAELSQQALQITSQGQYIQVLQAPDKIPQAPDIPIIETGNTAETPKIKKDNILKRIFKRKQKNEP